MCPDVVIDPDCGLMWLRKVGCTGRSNSKASQLVHSGLATALIHHIKHLIVRDWPILTTIHHPAPGACLSLDPLHRSPQNSRGMASLKREDK